MKITIDSDSPEKTINIAEKIGTLLRGGEIIELVSDLGGGKTTFVNGLAKGIGSNDHVASPTFTISRIYKGLKLIIHHFDFYRLNEAGLMIHELQDALDNPSAVIVIEWADVVKDVIPEDHLEISIETTDNNSRKLIINCPDNMAYLIG